MKQDLISVIVPVYNVEQYLERCINSILKQTYSNLEIILVDDGATDSSGDMCDVFAKKDERVKVIHKSNGGLSDARNEGMKIATGEYVAFIDSDDYVDTHYIEKLYKMCVNNQADIAVCGLCRTSEDNLVGSLSEDVVRYTNKQAMEQMLYQKKFNMTACAKLYKKFLLEDILFPTGKLYEDVNTTYKFVNKAENVVYTDDKLYFYYINPNSITQTDFNLRKMDYVVHMQEVLEFIEKEYPDLFTAAKFRYVWANIHVWVHVPDRKKYIDICTELESNIKKYRSDVLKDRKIGLKNYLIIFLTYFGWKNMRRVFLWKN